MFNFKFSILLSNSGGMCNNAAIIQYIEWILYLVEFMLPKHSYLNVYNQIMLN